MGWDETGWVKPWNGVGWGGMGLDSVEWSGTELDGLSCGTRWGGMG